MQEKKIRQPLNSFEDVQAFLEGLGIFSMEFGLDRMKKAIKLLGLRFFCPIVQVVGTNGKGSTATFLHSIAVAHGLRAGLFTSPHFVSPLERIRMNDKLLPKEIWASYINQALEVVPDLTYFELITIISLMAFSFAEPDILIYEAGLGGKNDATTAIETDLLCITPIDLDHKKQLGDNLKDIAREKSQAIREDVFAVVSACQNEDVLKILQERAKDLNVPFYGIDSLTKFPEKALIESYGLETIGLKGSHQHGNAQVALVAWYLLCQKRMWFFEPKAIAKGLKNAFIAGRFQKVQKLGFGTIILDGAHNAHGLKTLIKTLLDENIKPKAFVFSCLENKEPKVLVEILENFLESQFDDIPIFLVPIPDNPNAVSSSELASFFNSFSTQTQICNDLVQSLESIKEYYLNKQNNSKNKAEQEAEQAIVICGSLYLLAEYFKVFPEDLKIKI